jgi:hypothetical protein
MVQTTSRISTISRISSPLKFAHFLDVRNHRVTFEIKPGVEVIAKCEALKLPDPQLIALGAMCSRVTRSPGAIGH